MAKKRKERDPVGMFDKNDEGRHKALQVALDDLTKRFGDGTIMSLGDAAHLTIDVIPTGSLGLDIALGVGGIPRGRVTEIYGAESSGKTTLCLHIIREAQKRGGICAFIDMEHALDPIYAERIGVSLDSLYVSQPDTAEQALEIVETLVRSGALDVVVVDSVAALVPRAEIEGEMGDSHVGLQARLMSQALRKLTGAIKQSNVSVIFTNQLREKIGVMFGCFGYQAPVLLADGTSANIGRIVNQKEPVEVMSWNADTGCFEPKRVINWFKNGIEVDQFQMNDNEIGELRQEYRTLIAYYPDGSGFEKVTSTPNHMIATPQGFRMAMDIDLGDQILCRHDEVVFSRDLYQLILGSMLGDGSVRQSGHHTAYFREEHGIAQQEYVEWKKAMFGEFVRSSSLSTDKCGFETKANTAFARFKKLFYKDKGRYKVLTEQALRQLTPFSLAVWYQDDGSRQDENGKRSRNAIYFHKTDDATRQMIEETFQRMFGLECKVYATKTSSAITFTGENAVKFEQIIAPYIHLSMAYKLRQTENIGVQLDTLVMSYETQEVSLPCEVYEVRRQIRIGKEAVRYNLQVEDNATYVVGSVIVHNSPETQPGGRALKFYASVRLDIRRIQGIKSGEDDVGNRARVKVKKNKVAPPFKECEFDIMFTPQECGISKAGEIADLAVELGIIEKRGAFFRFNETLLGQGRENTKQYLVDHMSVSDGIESTIRQHFGLPPLDAISIGSPVAVLPGTELEGAEEE